MPGRSLPHDFVLTSSATHKHFPKFTRTGLWRRMVRILREETRRTSGRKPRPTGAVADSSSVKATPLPGPRGFDGGKLDTTSLLVAVHVTAANIQDWAAFPALLSKTTRVRGPIRKDWLDKGYTGKVVADTARAGVEVEIVSGPNPSNGSSSSPAAGSWNAPTARSTATADSSASTRPPPPHTKDSSSPARSA